ncbi:MAG TPA: hypothetical protein V6D48_24345 [Oculatellaceae cyanobacterium]
MHQITNNEQLLPLGCDVLHLAADAQQAMQTTKNWLLVAGY